MPGLLADGFKDWFVKLNFREPGSSAFAADSDHIFYLIFLLSTFFFVLLMGLMFFFALKYRKRAGAVPQRSANHNTLAELSWSVIPTILLVWMFFEGFWGFAHQIVAPSEAPEFNVTASKWAWNLKYPNGATSPVTTDVRNISGSPVTTPDGKRVGGTSPTPIFVIPEEHPVMLRMHSIDVIHSFWVPAFRAKFDVFPNRYTTTWFNASKIKGGNTLPNDKDWGQWAGTPYEDHWVFCAEYCGDNHSDMYAILRVVPYQTFLSIADDWAKPKGEPWEKGQFFWKTKGCYSCHTTDGAKLVGPTWKDMYGAEVELTTGEKFVRDANYIRKSIREPGSQIVKGYPNQMTMQALKDEEIEDLIAYMQRISKFAPPQLPKPEGVPEAEKK
jgi:cytochrome c oxidase subunit II